MTLDFLINTGVVTLCKRRRLWWAHIAVDAALTAIGVVVAGFVVGFGLGS